MFGYVLADRDGLSEEALARYKGCYCGLCRELKQRHGSLSRMTLTYDLAFLALLLTALEEPPEETGTERCIVHPLREHPYWHSEYTAYAADMTVVLAYHKCRDDWDDDCDPVRLLESKLLKSAYKRVCAQYEEKCAFIAECLERLGELERRRAPDPDGAAAVFGELMGELFCVKDGYRSETLRAMGAALGRFVYIMDAVIDREDDLKRGRYNPLEAFPDSGGDHHRAALEMLMGECVYHFDRLPIVADADILRNVLCSGVWTVYMNKFYPKKKGAADDTGSL